MSAACLDNTGPAPISHNVCNSGLGPARPGSPRSGDEERRERVPLLTFDWFFVPSNNRDGLLLMRRRMTMMMMMMRRCSSCRLGLCLDFTFVTPAPHTFIHMYFRWKPGPWSFGCLLFYLFFGGSSCPGRGCGFDYVFLEYTMDTRTSKRSKHFEVAPFEMLYRLVSDRIMCVYSSASPYLRVCLAVYAFCQHIELRPSPRTWPIIANDNTNWEWRASAHAQRHCWFSGKAEPQTAGAACLKFVKQYICLAF